MKSLDLITNSSFDPTTIEMLGEVFDTVWSEVSGYCAPADVESEREALAHFLLNACRETPDPSKLTELARARMRPTS